MSNHRGERRIAVRFYEGVWREAIRGFSGRALEIATAARRRLEEDDVALSWLLPCEPVGPDRTELAGCAKLYLPLLSAPASQRPFAFVFQLARSGDGAPVLVFVAFGPRHPGPGVRNVYERAPSDPRPLPKVNAAYPLSRNVRWSGLIRRTHVWFKSRPIRAIALKAVRVGFPMADQQRPLARSERLITEALGDELLVYDVDSDEAHSLDASAAAIWCAWTDA